MRTKEYHVGYARGLEHAIELLLDYSDADGEVTEGRGIIQALRELRNKQLNDAAQDRDDGESD